jgi:hypothetical protein
MTALCILTHLIAFMAGGIVASLAFCLVTAGVR